ncbi:hypothetical protein [Gymnodinialimonas sp.]
MTKFATLSLLAVLATTPAFAQDTRGENRPGAESFSAAEEGETIRPRMQPTAEQPRRSAARTLRLVDQGTGDPLEMSAAEASDWADMLCEGDSLIWYDEDENGQPVDGTIEFECL